MTAQPAPPGAVTSRKNFVLGGEGGLRVGVVEVPFLGGGGGARGCARGAAVQYAATHGRKMGLRRGQRGAALGRSGCARRAACG